MPSGDAQENPSELSERRTGKKILPYEHTFKKDEVHVSFGGKGQRVGGRTEVDQKKREHRLNEKSLQTERSALKGDIKMRQIRLPEVDEPGSHEKK